MKIKINNISILINFIPSLWKMYFFHFYKRGITGRTFLNVFLLGFQIRIIKYKKFKEISIEELKNLINEKQKYDNRKTVHRSTKDCRSI